MRRLRFTALAVLMLGGCTSPNSGSLTSVQNPSPDARIFIDGADAGYDKSAAADYQITQLDMLQTFAKDAGISYPESVNSDGSLVTPPRPLFSAWGVDKSGRPKAPNCTVNSATTFSDCAYANNLYGKLQQSKIAIDGTRNQCRRWRAGSANQQACLSKLDGLLAYDNSLLHRYTDIASGIATTRWAAIFQAGANYIDHSCSDYLKALFVANRSASPAAAPEFDSTKVLRNVQVRQGELRSRYAGLDQSPIYKTEAVAALQDYLSVCRPVNIQAQIGAPTAATGATPAGQPLALNPQ